MLLSSAQQPVTAGTALAFDGVTVVDVEQGKLLPAQRVVIAGNRIQTVGDVGAVTMPKGAQIVDARDRYLIPGLWDMHVHTTASFPYSLLIANGVTGIRDAWSYVPLDTMVQWQREILAGTRVGPPRQLLTGDHASLDELTEQGIAARRAAGATLIKVYPFDFDAAAAARRVGIRFGGHVQGVSAIEASDSGISIIDHINTSGGLDTLCMGGEGSVERCQPAAEQLRRNGTWFVPTLVAFGELSNGGYLMESARRIFASFTKRAREFWAGTLLTGPWLRQSSDHAETFPAPLLDSLYAMQIMQRAGMPILAGTDVDVGPSHMYGAPPGFALHVELAMLVTEGVTPLNALQSATLNPATMLHATDSLGTVAPGKLADLVLLDANPLADITNTTTIRAVVANGRYFDRAALDRLMVDAQTQAKQGFQYWWSGGEQTLVPSGAP